MGRPKIRTEEYMKLYRREWARKNRQNNREAINEYRRNWREKNKDRVNELSRKWRVENQERVKKTTRAYLLRNREKLNKQVLDWQKRNRDKVYTRNARRRALKAKVKHIPYNREEIYKRDGGKCFVCNEHIDRDLPARHRFSFTIHHIKPIYLQGADTPDNVTSAHYSCNSSIGIKVLV